MSRDLDSPDWAAVTAALAQRADAEGLLDVALVEHPSPIGTLLLAGTRQGLVRVGLPGADAELVLVELARRVSGRVLRASRPVLDDARRQLDAYFDRTRTRFELPLDWRLTVGFRREVLRATAEIPYGATASYAEMAERAGSPRAVRAAGTALALNPLPIVVPCHRVLRTGGDLGAYGGGVAMKARLLDLEAARG